MPRLRSVLLALCLLSVAVPVGAEEPSARLARLHAALDADELHVQIWWYGWSGLFAGAGGVQTGLAVLSNDSAFRTQNLVSATDSWLAVAGMALTPVKPGQRWDLLADAPVDIRLKLAEAELRDRARRERQVGGWLDHALCAVVAVGSSAYLWLHEKQPGGALMVGLSDLVIGEIQLLTVPHAAVHAVEVLDAERALPSASTDTFR